MDALLSLENEFRSEGARAGFSKGAALGHTEGRGAGFDAGASRGLERQFYRGGACALLSLAAAHPGHFSPRALSAARAAIALARAHEMHISGNDSTRDVDADLNALRHQFRLLCALARLPPIRPVVLQKDPALSF